MKRKQLKKPDYYSEREWRRIQAKEAQEEKKMRQLFLSVCILLLLTAAMVFALYYFVLRSHDTELRQPFSASWSAAGSSAAPELGGTAKAMAGDLCVTAGDVNADSIFITATEGALFDVSGRNVCYAKNIFEERSPASLTKVMTALVALKYGNPDQLVTVTETAFNIETGSSVCELHLGDVLTLKQLLYGMLIASGNDAAMMIAETVGGSVSGFVDMMNQEALNLGATRTHFQNPHGLTQEGHYTCAYDMYLIFRAAMQYDMFMDIISRNNYYAEYKDATGDAYAMTWETTDLYLTGQAQEPDNVIIYGGKTGTTESAGACLVLLTKDLYGNPYISVVMNSDSHDTLYVEMNQVLSLVPA